jgi:hypothetical protein
MKKFIQRSRYRVARTIIHAGLIIMPASRYKTRLLEVLWDLNAEVMDAVHGDTSKHRLHTTKYEDLCQ